MYLSNFRSRQPEFIVDQAEGLRWLARCQSRGDADVDVDTQVRRIARFGCGPDTIARRGTFLEDFTLDDPGRMRIFGDDSRGEFDARQAFFAEAVRAPVEEITPADPDFAHWIHVTCTGYLAPSVVQEIVSRRGWGDRIETLHAYHMGCYAAIPALRMARGLGAVEVTHTELCTLHLEPTNVAPEQLVIQSLFADGIIAYRVTDERPPVPHFAVDLTREIVTPESLDAMTWALAPRGFRMTLSRRVPSLVRDHVAAIVAPHRRANTMFAIHPGGPRIIDAVREALDLSEDQVHFSREVLREHGNMSSATLPHVWRNMLEQVPSGTPVISLAFGPGLTVALAVARTER